MRRLIVEYRAIYKRWRTKDITRLLPFKWLWLANWDVYGASSYDFRFKAAIRRVDFANPFLVKIKNIIISKLLDLSIFCTNSGLGVLQRHAISQAVVLYSFLSNRSSTI